MIVERIEVGAFAENCYVVGCEASGRGVIIDPGDEIDRILQHVQRLSLQIQYILVTHAHIDHVKELSAMQEKLDVPTLMHQEDEFLLNNLLNQAAAFGLSCSGIPRIDRYIQQGDTVAFGEIMFQIKETPGHSPGSVTFHTDESAFVGDVLFAGSIGRTDLPGGNMDILMQSIKDTLIPLGDHMVIYPGHGPETTIAQEREVNPFLLNQY